MKSIQKNLLPLAARLFAPNASSKSMTPEAAVGKVHEIVVEAKAQAGEDFMEVTEAAVTIFSVVSPKSSTRADVVNAVRWAKELLDTKAILLDESFNPKW